MVFNAGQKVRAQELNDLVLGVVMTADVTRTNSTTFANATGLVMPLAANATYGLDGWLHWTSPQAADIKLQYTFPAGATGQWAGIGPRINEDPTGDTTPRINYIDFGSVPLTSFLQFTGDDIGSPTFVSAMPRGYIVTTNSGNLQLQFAQVTANASPTILRRGSWLRVTRLA